MKWELEDLCLRYLEPEKYYDLVERINMKREERENFIASIIDTLQQELQKSGIKAEISGRPKHFYSIYNKMKRQSKDLNELYDLFAVRLLVENVHDCYGALGIVHTIWKPLPMRFKDYIAMPKPNMYQSLHTTVIGSEGEPFEIQIRTYEMHRTAEYGIAAHWIYKESGNSEISKSSSQLSWLEQIKEMQSETENNKEFLNSVKIDLFSDTVFIFSPNGEVYELPAGSVPLDFAYRVHTEVGNRCVGAKVNKRIVPLDYTLKNGDLVEILTSKQSNGPSLDWVNLCKTSQARNKIRQWFKKAGREENLQRGKEQVEHELKKKDVDMSLLQKSEILPNLAQRMGFSSWDDVCVSVGVGTQNVVQLASRIYDEYQKQYAPKTSKTVEEILSSKSNKDIQRKNNSQKSSSNNGVIVEGMEEVPVRFAHCCKPLPGDPIIGYITRGRGVTVHHAGCPNMQSIEQHEPDRVIAAHWDESDAGVFQVEVFVIALDRPKITPEVMELINDAKVHITSITSKVKGARTYMDISIEVHNLEQVSIMIDKIKNISDVLEVKRTLSN